MQGKRNEAARFSREIKMMVMEKEDFNARLMDSVGKVASKMGLDVSEEMLEKIATYGDELQKWNKAYNLVGRKTGEEGIIGLYMDALSPLSIRGLFDGRKEVLDLGSGAGMPGIPLYMVAGPFPITLVESQRKKITFLRHVVREDQLNAYEVGLARAVMDPLRLIKLARPLLCEGGKMVVFVGKTDAERMRKSAQIMNEKGLYLETMKSTQRIIGRENYLAVIRKASR